MSSLVADRNNILDDNFTVSKSNEFMKRGFCTLENLFSIELIDSIKEQSINNYKDALNIIKTNNFEFGVGIKHGFKEIVQRHRGRYEMPHKMEYIQRDFIMKNSIIDKLLKLTLGENYQLVNNSLVISEPNSSEQAWHVDGPHMSTTEHLSVHCLNIFIPLVDLTVDNGPTEIRPESHLLTRDLSKMFLAAAISKRLKKPEIPLIKRGSCLLFDYRVLHRGTANQTNEVRPILVYTFAKDWYKDVLNFPKRTLLNTAITTTASKNSTNNIITPEETPKEEEDNNEDSMLLSGKCKCGSVHFSIGNIVNNGSNNTLGSSLAWGIFICHCSMCPTEGKTYIGKADTTEEKFDPGMRFIAVNKEAFYKSVIQSNNNNNNSTTTTTTNNNNNSTTTTNNNNNSNDENLLEMIRSSSFAKRGRCRKCKQPMTMEYDCEVHTIWIALDCIDNNDVVFDIMKEKYHIHCHNLEHFTQSESAMSVSVSMASSIASSMSNSTIPVRAGDGLPAYDSWQPWLNVIDPCRPQRCPNTSSNNNDIKEEIKVCFECFQLNGEDSNKCTC